MSMAIKSQGHVAAKKGGDTGGAKQKALEAAKSLEEYLLIHYTMARDYAGVDKKTGRSDLTIHDLVHYHVYGDYRLLISEAIGPGVDGPHFNDPGNYPPNSAGEAQHFDEDELVKSNEAELSTRIRMIEEAYKTTQSVMSPYVSQGGTTVFPSIPMMRFKTTRYHADENGDRIGDEVDDSRLALRLNEEGRGTRIFNEKIFSGIDKLNGFFTYGEDEGLYLRANRRRDTIRPRMSQWANNQLHSGTQATRFFLPSLGTMLVSGEVSKIDKYVGGRLDFITEEIVENLPDARYNALPEFMYRTAEQLGVEYELICPTITNIQTELESRNVYDAPRIFFAWAKHICSHPDYMMYLEQTVGGISAEDQEIITNCGGQIFESRNTHTSADTKTIMPKRIFTIANEATRKANNMSKAGEHFIKQLLNAGRAEFGAGTAVKLKDRNPDSAGDLERVVDALDPDGNGGDNEHLQTEFDSADVFYVHSVTVHNGEARYQLSRRYKGEYKGEQVFPIDVDGVTDLNLDNWYKRNDFNVYNEDDDEELNEEDIREKGFSGKIEPLHKVFMRIVMDIYMTFETYASLLSNSVSYKKFSRFQGKNQDPNIKATAGGPAGGRGGGSSKAIGEFLAEQRLEIALGQLATQYSTAKSDSESMRTFYSQDLLGAEVQWLSNSISDFMPNLISASAPSRGNMLVQQMYVPPQGIDADQVQYERVKPEIIFLRLDSALLRDIFIEYTRQNNYFIASIAAQSGKKGKKNRKGQQGKNKNQKNQKILPTMWTMFKQHALSIASSENLKPHDMWNILLDEVDKFRSELTMEYPLIPEHWATTYTVANLRKDPELYGETIDEDKQQDLLAEYLNFLESTYYNSYNFIASVTSAMDKVRISMVSDLDTLKSFFVQRLQQDSSSKILGRAFFPAYQTLLYIMRSFADIPASVRGEYTAQHFDEQAKQQMRETMRGTPGSMGGEAVVGQIIDGSPALLREGQVVRRPGL